jgi:CPA2 family monovalent cation:H+ antiporter-2
MGEFSFILASASLRLGLMPAEGRDLILSGAIITILLNPLLFAVLDMYAARREKEGAEEAPTDRQEEEEVKMREPIRPTSLTNHVVLVGHGRVGSFISAALKDRDIPLLVIEDNDDKIAELKERGVEVLVGNAADPEVIEAANLGAARYMLVAIPDAFEGGQVVQQARALNANLPIIARAHFEKEIGHLKEHGANVVVMGEHEIAKSMLDNVAEGAPLPAL